MKADLRLPKGFIELQTQEAIYSNLEDEIKEEVQNAIYNKPFFARHAAWDFNGLVWWDDTIGYWSIEIWKYSNYECSHIAENLEELIDEVKRIHGEK